VASSAVRSTPISPSSVGSHRNSQTSSSNRRQGDRRCVHRCHRRHCCGGHRRVDRVHVRRPSWGPKTTPEAVAAKPGTCVCKGLAAFGTCVGGNPAAHRADYWEETVTGGSTAAR
jgi:hypothetical protein